MRGNTDGLSGREIRKAGGEGPERKPVSPNSRRLERRAEGGPGSRKTSEADRAPSQIGGHFAGSF